MILIILFANKFISKKLNYDCLLVGFVLGYSGNPYNYLETPGEARFLHSDWRSTRNAKIIPKLCAYVVEMSLVELNIRRSDLNSVNEIVRGFSFYAFSILPHYDGCAPA